MHDTSQPEAPFVQIYLFLSFKDGFFIIFANKIQYMHDFDAFYMSNSYA